MNAFLASQPKSSLNSSLWIEGWPSKFLYNACKKNKEVGRDWPRTTFTHELLAWVSVNGLNLYIWLKNLLYLFPLLYEKAAIEDAGISDLVNFLSD